MKSFGNNKDKKGTNVTSASFHSSGSQRNSDEFPNLQRVRNDVTDVINNIDVLHTPHPCPSVSATNDLDDDSRYSTTSFISSVLKFQHITTNNENSAYDSPRDVSEVSTSAMESENYSMTNNAPQEMHMMSKPICVPAVLPPAVLCMNPSCICSHSVGYTQQFDMAKNSAPRKKKSLNKIAKTRKLSDFIQKFKKSTKEEFQSKELYKINIMQQSKGNVPQRFVFDRVQEDQKPLLANMGTNTKARNKCKCTYSKSCIKEQNYKPQGILYNQCSYHSALTVNDKFNEAHYCNSLHENAQLSYKNERDAARVDVYYFDHGNSAYYRTTDSYPAILTETLGEKAENYASKFWAELFGSIYIISAFITTFVLQFLRFLLHSVFRPLTIGILQISSDYFIKPFLAVLFNAIIQPPLIFFYNIATSLRDLCDPIAEGAGYFLREISIICKSIRLFEIRKEKRVKCENEEKGTQYERKPVSATGCP